MTTLLIDDLIVKPHADQIRELSRQELSRVSGGMKWQKGTANDDVIDARGGSMQVLGFVVTFDINGNLSSAKQV
jgi:hypothetical protein